MTHTVQPKARRAAPPPEGLAVVERQGVDHRGDPYQIKVAVAGVVVNGHRISSNLVALLLASSLEGTLTAAPAAAEAGHDRQ